MDRDPALAMLYADLGRKPSSTPDIINSIIESCLDAAAERLEDMGIDLGPEAAGTRRLWVMYGAYLYRHRDSDKPMPRSLRLAINDAKVHGATTKGAAT